MDNYDAIRADPKLCFLEKNFKVCFKLNFYNFLLGISFKCGA